MKKIIAVIGCAIFVAAITNNSFAGNYNVSNYQTIAAAQESYVASEKTTPAASAGFTKKATVKELKAKLRATKINNKISSYIDDHFTDVSGIKVYPDNGVLVSKFMMNDRAARVVFNANGNWMYTVINGQEKDLSKSDRQMLNKRFKNFSITLVQEIRQEGMSFYKIFLENNVKLSIIFLCDGEISIDKEYTR